MKSLLHFAMLFLSIATFGQKKAINFYDESGKEITKEIFVKSIDHSKNIDLYFENDSLNYALLVIREKEGQLENKTFARLKNYLAELSGAPIDSTKNIVINYLSGLPKYNGDSEPLLNLYTLESDYLKKLHRIAKIQQFWIHSPETENPEEYIKNNYNWIADKNRFFMDVFFRYEFPYGNYILIKPDGKFYFYLGEHSKERIWKSARKFF